MTRLSDQFVLSLIVILVLSPFGSAEKRKKSLRPGVTPVPTVDFCDLTVHPERYVGRVVRVKASLVSWWESSYLYNAKCESNERKIQDALDCAGEKECEEVGKRVYGVINRQQRADKNEYAFRAYVTVLGQLLGPSEVGFGHLNWSKFEFRISKLEAAAPMPRDVPYADERERSSP